MISVICFSKDRPLQLHAYLESLMHYSGLQQDAITVLYKVVSPITYNAVIDSFPNVHWVSETSFAQDLLSILSAADDLVLWGCDDVVFKSQFDIGLCIKAFDDPKLFGFTLRQGGNLAGFNEWLTEFVSYENGVLVWDRVKLATYPWEVSASIYRKSDILDLLDMRIEMDQYACDEVWKALWYIYKPGDRLPAIALITGPNMLEWVPFYWHGKSWAKCADRSYMACFAFSKSVSFSVNRVQEVAPNSYDCVHTEPEELYWAYTVEGKRLDWRALGGWANEHTHKGAERFALVGGLA